MGNYKSFGDTKFIPEVPPTTLRRFLSYGETPHAEIEALLAGPCADRMYSLPLRHRQVGPYYHNEKVCVRMCVLFFLFIK